MRIDKYYSVRHTTLTTDFLGLVCNIVALFLITVSTGFSQGTSQPFAVTFDGPPRQPPGTGATISYYAEGGVAFQPVSPDDRFGRQGGSYPGYPENGTTYIQSGGQSIMFSFINGDPFALLSVDLAEYSSLDPDPVTVHFVGYHPDGSTVAADLTTDGINDSTGPLVDFQTFYFGPEFSNLTRVEMPSPPDGYSMDNVVVGVPEPGTGRLALLFVILSGSLKKVRQQAKELLVKVKGSPIRAPVNR